MISCSAEVPQDVSCFTLRFSSILSFHVTLVNIGPGMASTRFAISQIAPLAPPLKLQCSVSTETIYTFSVCLHVSPSKTATLKYSEGGMKGK